VQSRPGFNSLRYLGTLCVSAVSEVAPTLTAETHRTQVCAEKKLK
jgi:hypothetical protein